MKSFDLCPYPFTLALFIWATCPTQCPASSLDPQSNNGPNSFDMGSFYGSGSPGVQSNTSIGVQGESHPYAGAGQVNQAGPLRDLPISDYPNWSSEAQRSATNGANVPHQQPIGTRGGLPPTTTKLFGTDPRYFQNPISSGQYSFGYNGNLPELYQGVRNNSHGVMPQGLSDMLPPTSTGSLEINITTGGGH